MRPQRVREQEFNRRGFWALIVTQFQAAVNDNLYQWTIVYFLVSLLSQSTVAHTTGIAHVVARAVGYLGGEFTRDAKGLISLTWGGVHLAAIPQDYVPALATFLFSLPFILFPSFFGALADRYSKQRVACWTKYFEGAIMIAGGLAFLTETPLLIFFILFLMATHSSMFGPAKYGIMPEILPEARLSWGNGILQMGTIVAIILGTMLAGPLYEVLKPRVYIISIMLTGFSALGLLSAQYITPAPAANPAQPLRFNPLLPWRGMGPYFRAIWKDPVMLNVVLAYNYFWFVGALMRNTIFKFSSATLHLSEAHTSYLLGAIAIGIGIGAVSAGYCSRGKIELGLVPLGAFGMMLFSLLLAIPASAYGAVLGGAYFWIMIAIIFGMGFFAGVFDVPLAASIQHRAPDDMKGGIIATTNMLTFVGMAISSIVFLALGAIELSTYTVFLIIGVMSAVMGIYICVRLPHLIVRSLLWLATSVYCRIQVFGRDLIAPSGGQLWVANHVSIIDCLALIASTGREVSTCVNWHCRAQDARVCEEAV